MSTSFAKGKVSFGLLVEFKSIGVRVPRSRVFATQGSVKRVKTKHEYNMKSIMSGQNLGFPSDFYHLKQAVFQHERELSVNMSSSKEQSCASAFTNASSVLTALRL